MQAYRHWKKSSHEYLFISNNDVLVPNGALTSLMRVMREDGEACQLLCAVIHAPPSAAYNSLYSSEGPVMQTRSAHPA